VQEMMQDLANPSGLSLLTDPNSYYSCDLAVIEK